MNVNSIRGLICFIANLNIIQNMPKKVTENVQIWLNNKSPSGVKNLV